MKKSELYRSAQIAVINSRHLTPETKIDVLRILFGDEDVALYQEQFMEESDVENEAGAAE